MGAPQDPMMDNSQNHPIDPITLEVVIEALMGIVREMRVTVIRTAYSSVVCHLFRVR